MAAEKLLPARARLDPAGAFEVQVDGGAKASTAAAIGRGGTDVVVVGSALYRSADMAAEVERIRSIVSAARLADARRLRGSVRALLQRVTRAEVRVGERTVGSIGQGLLVLLGVGHHDDEATADALARRVCELRIFEDDDGRTNRSLIDVAGAALVVSQFTLYADTRRGRRPGFTDAAPPDRAIELWRRVAAGIEAQGVPVAVGEFGAEMAVELVNDGPFTIWLDTADR